MMCGQVWCPIPIQVHIHSSEHTHRKHTTGAEGSQCYGAWGAVGGSVPCSRAPQSWCWGWRDNSCRTWDSNPWPSGTSPTLYPLGHNCPPQNDICTLEVDIYIYIKILNKCKMMKLSLLSIKDALNWSKVTVKVYTFYKRFLFQMLFF